MCVFRLVCRFLFLHLLTRLTNPRRSQLSWFLYSVVASIGAKVYFFTILPSPSSWYLVFAAAVALIQLVGHLVFEGRLPAFRAFEAFFTTPFFLMMWVLSITTGYGADYIQVVERNSFKWKGKRSVYG